MTSRPVRLFIAENGIDIEEQVVDIDHWHQLDLIGAVLRPSDDDLRVVGLGEADPIASKGAEV